MSQGWLLAWGTAWWRCWIEGMGKTGWRWEHQTWVSQIKCERPMRHPTQRLSTKQKDMWNQLLTRKICSRFCFNMKIEKAFADRESKGNEMKFHMEGMGQTKACHVSKGEWKQEWLEHLDPKEGWHSKVRGACPGIEPRTIHRLRSAFWIPTNTLPWKCLLKIYFTLQ